MPVPAFIFVYEALKLGAAGVADAVLPVPVVPVEEPVPVAAAVAPLVGSKTTFILSIKDPHAFTSPCTTIGEIGEFRVND